MTNIDDMRNWLINNCSSLEREAAEIRQELATDRDDHAWRAIGESYGEMLLSREVALSGIKSADSATQCAAIELFSGYWPTDGEVETALTEQSRSRSRQVQLAAIRALAYVRAILHGTAAAETIGSFVLDVTLPIDVRNNLYLYLRRMASRLDPQIHVDNDLVIDADSVRQCTVACARVARPLGIKEKQALVAYEQGRELFSRSQFDAALEKFAVAIAHWRTPGTLMMMARTEVKLGRVMEAIEQCNAAIKIMPGLPHLYRERAQLYSKVGRTSLATADLRTADALSDRRA